MEADRVRHAGRDAADRDLGAAAAVELQDHRGDVVGRHRAGLAGQLDLTVPDHRTGRDRSLRDQRAGVRGDAADRACDVLEHREDVRADVDDRASARLLAVVRAESGVAAVDA